MYVTNKPDTFINKNYANCHNVTRADFEANYIGTFDAVNDDYDPVRIYSLGGNLFAWHNSARDWGFREAQ